MNDIVKLDFNKFKAAVASQFAVMQNFELFRTKTDEDILWSTYLNNFPQDEPPVCYRSLHNCNTCKSFITDIGNVVAKKDGQLISLWDINIDEPIYKKVANAMAAYVKSQPVSDSFTPSERTIGKDKSYQRIASKTTPNQVDVLEWEHFLLIWRPMSPMSVLFRLSRLKYFRMR